MGMGTVKISVISDIHMSNNAQYAWFRDQQAVFLSAMLNSAADNSRLDELLLLGDAFDLWVYPIQVPPCSFKDIIAVWDQPAKGATNSVMEALERCINNLPKVCYINGNHDMQVTREQVEGISAGGKHLLWTTPQAYNQQYGGRLHVEHGHDVDMFNAPDNAPDTLNGMPLGYYISRLVATAAQPHDKWRKFETVLRDFHATHLPGARLGEEAQLELGEMLVHAIIDALMVDLFVAGDPVSDNTEIIFADPSRNVTIGQVKDSYHSLLGRWDTGDLQQLLDNMLVCVIPNGLDWYANKLLKGEDPPQAVVFGHTHHGEQYIFGSGKYGNDGCWCNNPKNSKPTAVELDVTATAIDVTLTPWPEAK